MRVLLSITTMLLLLTACLMPPVPAPRGEDDDDQQQQQVSTFAGEYRYTAVSFSNGSLGLQGTPFGTFTGTGTEIFGSIVLTDNPKQFSSNISYTANLSVTVFQQTQEIELPIDKRVMQGSWAENGGVITFSPDDGSTLKLESISKDQMSFTGNFDEKLPLGQFNLDATADLTYTAVR